MIEQVYKLSSIRACLVQRGHNKLDRTVQVYKLSGIRIFLLPRGYVQQGLIKQVYKLSSIRVCLVQRGHKFGPTVQIYKLSTIRVCLVQRGHNKFGQTVQVQYKSFISSERTRQGLIA